MFRNTKRFYRLPEGYTPTYKQEGKGVKDTIEQASEKVKSVTEGAKDISTTTTDIVQTIKNVPDSDIDKMIDLLNFAKTTITQKPEFVGENHTTLRMPDGSWTKASWCGPGTAISERLAAGAQFSNPKTAVDAVSKLHDLNYTLAKNSQDVRDADNRMLKAIQKIEREKGDHPYNIVQGKLIAGKIGLEKMGVPQSSFTTSGGFNELPPQDKENILSAKADLIQQGYGTKFDDRDIEKFKESMYPKPGERLARMAQKPRRRKKKKSKIPRKVQKRILEGMKLEDKFQESSKDNIPANVLAALNL